MISALRYLVTLKNKLKKTIDGMRESDIVSLVLVAQWL
jgi:hypothetical protein